jgi:hypothetical protein
MALCAGTAFAQIPNVSIYFDYNLTETHALCPAELPGTVLDSCYVVANNFNMWMNAIEYRIAYPPQMLYLGDSFPPDRLTIGNSATGVGVSWPLPANSFGAVVIQKVRFYWMCDNCDQQGPNADAPIMVLPYPGQTTVRAVRWPDLLLVPGVGMVSLICATVPVEETTWGAIKSMYE